MPDHGSKVPHAAKDENPESSAPTVVTPERVVERLLNEALSVPPAPEAPDWAYLSERSERCDAHVQRIEELEGMLAIRDKRIAQMETLLAQGDMVEILRDELEVTRAHSARLEQ